MDEQLQEALEMIEWLHAEMWCHFDPTDGRGDKDQPEDVKEVLAKARKLLDKHGRHPFKEHHDHF